LKNAAQTFQQLMDHLLQGLPFVYLDNILMASPSLVEHEAHLRQVLGVLRDNGLVVNPDKCQFSRETIEFLGHVVTKDGLSPLESHVGALVNFPPPSNVKQLQQFLGLLNFYRRFLQYCVDTAASHRRPACRCGRVGVDSGHGGRF
jgi:Reverse transcriptase (RNA-dependent DNA polymerase)